MPTFYEEIHFDYIHPLVPEGLYIPDDVYHNCVEPFRNMTVKQLDEELKKRGLRKSCSYITNKCGAVNKLSKFCILMVSILNLNLNWEIGILKILWDIYDGSAITSS